MNLVGLPGSEGVVGEQESLIKVLLLADSALPSGGFAYSSGIEYQIRAGRIEDEATVLSAVRDYVCESLTGRDLVFAAGGWRARSTDEMSRTALLHLATGRSEESRAERRNRARALIRIGSDLGVDSELLSAAGASYPVALGALGSALGIPLFSTVLTLGYQTVMGFLSAAVRLGVLGPRGLQRILRSLWVPVTDAAQTACQLEPGSFGGFAPEWELGRVRHEELESPLFLT